MSHTLIFSFDRKGDAKLCGAVSNSWRSAPLIWRYMEEKYLPQYNPPYLKALTAEQRDRHLSDTRSLPTRSSSLREDAINEICALVVDPLVPLEQRLVLATTLDKPLIHASDIPTMVAAFRAFPEEAGKTSLGEQADLLEAYIGNNDIIAFGWAQSSIGSKSWGEYHDDGSSDAKPYNCLCDDDHYWLVEDTTDIAQLREYAWAKLAELDSGKVELTANGMLIEKWWQFDAGTAAATIKSRVEESLQTAEKQVVGEHQED